MFTTDNTNNGLRIARNALRKMLWSDDVFAHRWMCHPGRPCEDGCDGGEPKHGRIAFYQSEIEE